MNYIVVDFEFNQAYDFELDQKTKSNPDCPFEIIQIGAVKLNENFEEIDKLNILIKPTVYVRLNPYVAKLTHFSDEDFENPELPRFESALNTFLEFCGKDQPILCIWGKSDIYTLHKNVEYFNLSVDNIPNEYINLQEYVSKKLKHYSGSHIGLKNAIEQLEIELELNYHDALNDAIYTAEILKVYKEKRIPVAKYSKPKRINKQVRVPKKSLGALNGQTKSISNAKQNKRPNAKTK